MSSIVGNMLAIKINIDDVHAFIFCPDYSDPVRYPASLIAAARAIRATLVESFKLSYSNTEIM